jgi:hypothetical protein
MEMTIGTVRVTREPMFEISIRLFSWETGDATVELSMPEDGELSELLDSSFDERRDLVYGTIRTRLQKEVRDAFEALKEQGGATYRLAPISEVG